MDTKAAFEKHLRDEGTKPAGWLKAEYWEIWQASRATIEIQLPGQENYDDPLSAHLAIKDCAEAINSHGIRIKGKTE